MKKCNKLYSSAKDLISLRNLILELAIKDFKVKYAGSYLGIVWGFAQPTVTILVFWFVFQVGFRSIPVQGVPYIIWLLSGIVPWFFIAESIPAATNSFIEYNYLVKKVVFKISSLPIVKIISALFIHLFFIAVLFIIELLYGYKFNIHYLQVFYYLFATLALVYSISLITSSIVPFIKDLGQFINIVIQIFFWLTPIFWNMDTIPWKYAVVLRFNLAYYIVQGYRDTFIYNVWFWQKWKNGLYFWVSIMILLYIGSKVFKKLKPHFADVL